MASRSSDWLRQGRRDLGHAPRAQLDADHEWACFAAHQAAGKALKAVFQARGEEAWGHAVKIFSLGRAAIRDALEDLVETRYRPDPNVVAVYLFGSFARGNPVPGSDVDLLTHLTTLPR